MTQAMTQTTPQQPSTRDKRDTEQNTTEEDEETETQGPVLRRETRDTEENAQDNETIIEVPVLRRSTRTTAGKHSNPNNLPKSTIKSVYLGFV
jgi:hypothetical protein